MHFKEIFQKARAHAMKFGLVKSSLFDLQICEVELNLKLKDYQSALEMIENLIPMAKKSQKIRKTFELYLLKSEIFIQTNRFQEALILLTHLFRNSESFGDSLKATLIYLTCLAKLGILKMAQEREQNSNKENKEANKNQSKDEINVKKIVNDDLLNLKNELKESAKLFMSELKLSEASQCLFLMAQLAKEKHEEKNKYANIFINTKKVQKFCKKNLELLKLENKSGLSFMKFIQKIRNVVNQIKNKI